MENEPKSAVSKFLEETSEQNIFEPVVTDPFNKTIEKTEVEIEEEKPLPFHKDPKVQRYIEKEIAKRIPVAESKDETKTEDFKDVMDSMTAAIGNDTPQKIAALDAYHKALMRLDQKGATQAQQYIEQIQSEEMEAEAEASEELDTAFDEIEENFGVNLTSPRSQKTRVEFLDFVEKIAPKDRNGEIVEYPDMLSAWETFSDMKKPSEPSRAKQLASRGMTRSAETTTAQPKRVDWNAVDDFMDTLK